MAVTATCATIKQLSQLHKKVPRKASQCEGYFFSSWLRELQKRLEGERKLGMLLERFRQYAGDRNSGISKL